MRQRADAWNTAEPLGAVEAKKLIDQIRREGGVAWTAHAVHELEADDMTVADGLRILRNGWVEEPELKARKWRYRVQNQEATLVVQFESPTRILVITGWRCRG